MAPEYKSKNHSCGPCGSGDVGRHGIRHAPSSVLASRPGKPVSYDYCLNFPPLPTMPAPCDMYSTCILPVYTIHNSFVSQSGIEG